MAISKPSTITGRAELLLPEPPAAVAILTETGGALRIELLSRNGLEYRARAPRLRMQPQTTVLVPVDAVDGRGHDVEMVVVSAEPETEWAAIVRLRVTAIHDSAPGRVLPRMRIGERAPLYAMTCQTVRTGTQFDVEIANLGTAEVALVSDREFHAGDLVALMPTVDGQPMRLRACVLSAERIDAHLMRVGCEITAITMPNRERIARVTAAAPRPAAGD